MNSPLGRRPVVRWVAALQVALLALAGLLIPGAPAAAGISPGTVLFAVPTTLPPELSSRATAKRVLYTTTTLDGATTTATGLVLTPTAGRQNATVVWGHGSTGLSDRCAPSANQDVFWPEARAAIAELLDRGWTVAAPDYPGLGTPSAHPYLVGESAARSMIDSVRAARHLDPALGTRYVVDGHSQGGQGALFAGELAPSYDGPLELRGVAAIAPASNLDVLAPEIPGTAGQGYLVMALYGLNAQDAGVQPYSLLAAPARHRSSVVHTGCLYEILAAYASLTPQQLLVNGALPASVIDKLAQYGNPGQAPSSAPILIVQGTEDEAVPSDVTEYLLVDRLDDYPQPVEFVSVDGANHDEAVFETVELVADWIAARFA